MNATLSSRRATAAGDADQLGLRPLERAVDDLLLFENHERYVQQSAATRAGVPAPLPPRAPASPLTGRPA